MAKSFPRPEKGQNPTAGGENELLDEIPDEGFGGSLAAYARGSKVRRLVWGGLIVGSIAAVFAGRWYIKKLEAERRKGIAPGYVVDAEHRDNAVRELHWEDGPARFALSREPPGVNVIILPDRELRLAPGHESAQLKLNVENGKTVMLRVLVGRIEQTRYETESPPPAPEATAR